MFFYIYQVVQSLGQVALELGSGRGRAALHLFLAGATVLGEGRSQVGLCLLDVREHAF